MKLRNKKTGGEVIDDGYVRETHDFQFDGQKHVLAVFKGHGHRPPERVSGAYKSLAELNEEWEDYKEPLIKDEKIRKAVRAWAEANDFTNEIEIKSLNAGTRFSEGHWSIEFIGYFIYDLKIGSTYTIAKLCGEEENDTSEQKD